MIFLVELSRPTDRRLCRKMAVGSLRKFLPRFYESLQVWAGSGIHSRRGACIDINIQEILISYRIIIYFTSVIKQFLFLFQQFLDPVYGQKDTPYTEFMAPGLIIS